MQLFFFFGIIVCDRRLYEYILPLWMIEGYADHKWMGKIT